jgi:hypothetical protein
MERPSGAQSGKCTFSFSRVSCSSAPVSRSFTNSWKRNAAPGSAVKATRRPSGDQAGEVSARVETVRFLASPPLAGMRKRSGLSSPP